MDEAENRNRRNNLRIVGLPEGVEGKNPTVFVEDLLKGLLPEAQFSPFFTVQRAHRTPLGPRTTWNPPAYFYFLHA